MTKEEIITGQLAKSDKGKLQLTLVPTQIVKDIAMVIKNMAVLIIGNKLKLVDTWTLYIGISWRF